MSFRRPRLSPAVSLAVGLAVGWLLASLPRPALRAQGNVRCGENDNLASGPLSIQYHQTLKVQIPQEALYYIDYKTGRLLATVPSFRQSVGGASLLDQFAERDLAADFKIDLVNGPRPHFLMTTGALGTFGDGWAPLFVFESTTSQVAVYRVQQQYVGTRARPQFKLEEIRSFAPGAAAASR
jgi:hypothetical protein